MSDVAETTRLGEGGGWVVRLTHRGGANGPSVAYTFLWRPYPTRQEAELRAQCWWSLSYGRTVIAVDVCEKKPGQQPRDEDWIPVGPGAKEACALLGSSRPRTEPPGTLHLVQPREPSTAQAGRASVVRPSDSGWP